MPPTNLDEILSSFDEELRKTIQLLLDLGIVSLEEVLNWSF